MCVIVYLPCSRTSQVANKWWEKIGKLITISCINKLFMMFHNYPVFLSPFLNSLRMSIKLARSLAKPLVFHNFSPVGVHSCHLFLIWKWTPRMHNPSNHNDGCSNLWFHIGKLRYSRYLVRKAAKEFLFSHTEKESGHEFIWVSIAMKHIWALPVPGLPGRVPDDTVILWVHPKLVGCKIDCGDRPNTLNGSPPLGSEIILRITMSCGAAHKVRATWDSMCAKKKIFFTWRCVHLRSLLKAEW